jgi:hypothetical protein
MGNASICRAHVGQGSLNYDDQATHIAPALDQILVFRVAPATWGQRLRKKGFDRGFIDSYGPIVPFILFSDRLDSDMQKKSRRHTGLTKMDLERAAAALRILDAYAKFGLALIRGKDPVRPPLRTKVPG